MSRPCGFPGGPAQVTELVYLYALGDARSLRRSPFAPRLSRSRRRKAPGSRRAPGRSWIYQEAARPGGGRAAEPPRRRTGGKQRWTRCSPSVLSASKVGNKLLYVSHTQNSPASAYFDSFRRCKAKKGVKNETLIDADPDIDLHASLGGFAVAP